MMYVCTYVYETAVAIYVLLFLFFEEELLLGLGLDHMLCCGVEIRAVLYDLLKHGTISHVLPHS